jgi:putative spermidine/putrescine transport system substrate-binding protein
MKVLNFISKAACIALLAFTTSIDTGAAESITVVSWGGNYTKNQATVFFEPFTKETGIEVKTVDWNGDLGKLRAMQQAGQVTWDVIVGDEYVSKIGCDEGLLAQINPQKLAPAPDGTPAAKDYVPGAIQSCGIGEMIFGIMLGYDPAKFPNGEPRTAADFFDLTKYPGKRGLYKRPNGTLSIALMADGVAPADVHKVLATPEGLDRAFKKLDTIKRNVVWWETFSQAPQLLNDGEVTMTSASGPRLIQPIVQDGKRWEVLFRDFSWTMDVWMVAKGAPNPTGAQRFLEFASRADRGAAMANLAAYSPIRTSAIALVGRNPITGADMRPFTLTDPEILARGSKVDADFWADHLDALQTRFNTWLAR